MSGIPEWCVGAIPLRLERQARDNRCSCPPSDPPAPTPTGLAHVATVSFLAARAAPSTQFWIALAGGIALARAAALRGVRAGYGASAAAMLQTVAVMGPARVNGPLTQALTAPLLGALHRRGTRVPLQIAACFAIRLTHYAVLTAAAIWIVLGGVDAYVGSYDTLTGWLGILPEGERGALIVTVVLNVALAAFYTRHAGARVPLGAAAPGRRSRARSTRPAAGPSEDRGSLRFDPRAITLAAAVAFALLLSGTWWALLAQRRRVAGARVGGLALRPGGARARAGADRAAVRRARWRRRLIAGLGLDEALRRGTRAGLLVLVATWLRAAAGPAGLRETFRRVLWRIRAVPPAREASAILDGLDSGGRLIASGRTLVDELGDGRDDARSRWRASCATGWRRRRRASARASRPRGRS